jgi:hypothetical protein
MHKPGRVEVRAVSFFRDGADPKNRTSDEEN